MRDLNRVSLGRYYPMASPVHRLDARVKIAGALYLVALSFACGSPSGVLILALFSLLVIYLAKLPPLQLLASLRSVFILLLVTSLAQLLFSPGRVLWELGPLKITNTGIQNGLVYSLRLALAAVTVCALTMTTDPVRLLSGLESLMSPLRPLRFPVRETAMILTTALRFLPTLLGKAGEIARAQEARGADFSSGNILRRARSLLPLLVPLFAACFRDAEELGTALAARGFRGGVGRSRYRASRPGRNDLAALAVLAAVGWLALWLKL